MTAQFFWIINQSVHSFLIIALTQVKILYFLGGIDIPFIANIYPKI